MLEIKPASGLIFEMEKHPPPPHIREQPARWHWQEKRALDRAMELNNISRLPPAAGQAAAALQSSAGEAGPPPLMSAAVEAGPLPLMSSVVEAVPLPLKSAAVVPLHQQSAAVEAAIPPPSPPSKTGAKAAELVIVADPLKVIHANNPLPLPNEIPLLPLPTFSWPGHYLPEDLQHHSPSLGDQGLATFPRYGDGGDASTQDGHVHHQAVGVNHGHLLLGQDELPRSQENTPQPLELTWVWETEVKKKKGWRKKKARS